MSVKGEDLHKQMPMFLSSVFIFCLSFTLPHYVDCWSWPDGTVGLCCIKDVWSNVELLRIRKNNQPLICVNCLMLIQALNLCGYYSVWGQNIPLVSSNFSQEADPLHPNILILLLNVSLLMSSCHEKSKLVRIIFMDVLKKSLMWICLDINW